uniref:cytoplasmic dynein 2 light intermediate chain 1-like isoform X2 n=1 Tax=Ciona intestinalis TaxID=7719 RepID=UPI000EF4E547|nr:cytoplasmic dynein 2 light intermediate chain 1-like isoform X2 [Ciona intestinalis]|eukprot:XP_026690374.1 cytoplasmic dynein 2 light intermediate chain 1-like isoform X2 [Ciona intestinalis]
MSKNVWDAAAAEVQLMQSGGGNSLEKFILFVGGKSSGKTTAILKFLSRDEAPRPTTALEYTFARRANNLVLDLSNPSELWYTAENLLKAARARIDATLSQMSKQKAGLQQKFLKEAWERLGGKDRPDAHVINPFLVPLVIIGSKFDKFQEMEPEQKKVITQCIRYLALSNGASAIFMSSKIEATVKGLRHIMNVAAFGGPLNKTPVIDNKRPLYVPAGIDSLDGIGSPPLKSSDIGRVSSRNPTEVWKSAFCGHFPQENTGSKLQASLQDDPAKDKQFKEPRIDELRAQKDRELEAFKKQEGQKWTTRIS